MNYVATVIDKFVPDIINLCEVEGINEVNADELEMPEDVEQAKVEYYEIQKGDTLWAISSKFLGKGHRYTEIVEANLEVIKNADLIYPGQKIRIPMD